MLLLAFLFYPFFLSETTSGAPLTLYQPQLVPRDPPAEVDTNYRSTPEIIWTCLATTFICTWVSVHPNAPSLEEPGYVIFRRRVFLMSIALLAPELMVLWAFKQWKGAKMIRDVVNGSLPESRKPPSSL